MDAVIIPEPFPFLVTAQLGVLWFQLHVTGKPAHVLDTSRGMNAIEDAVQMYQYLQGTLQHRYNTSLQLRNENKAFRDVQQPIHFNLGKISGGDWASSVPSFCSMDIRVGFFPSQSVESVKMDVENCLREYKDRKEKEGEKVVQYEITYFGFQAEGAVLLEEFCNTDDDDAIVKEEGDSKDAFGTCSVSLDQRETSSKETNEHSSGGEKSTPKKDETKDNNVPTKEPPSSSESKKEESYSSIQKEFVTLLQKSHQSAVLNTNNNNTSSTTTTSPPPPPLPLKPITCTTDARFYKLYSDIPCITCYGPEASNIHGIDESVCLESVRDVTATLALFIRDWCGLVQLE